MRHPAARRDWRRDPDPPSVFVRLADDGLPYALAWTPSGTPELVRCLRSWTARSPDSSVPALRRKRTYFLLLTRRARKLVIYRDRGHYFLGWWVSD